MTNDQLIEAAKKLIRDNTPTEADQLCCQVLARDPDNAEAIHLRGLILQQSGQLGQAVDLFQRAISISPNAVGYHNNLGVALAHLGRLEEAAAAYGRALQIKPELTHIRGNLNRVLKEMQRRGGAGWANAHGAPGGDDAVACNERGISLYDQDEVDQSVASFRQAVALRPSFAPAWNNLGKALRYQGDLENAVSAYRRAISIDVDYPEAHQGLAMALLQMGDYANGWLEYEWRWKVSTAQPQRFPQPRWCGEDPAGKTIFVHEEQGCGDAIQFFRYATLLADRGARVIIGCRPALGRLLEELPGASCVVVGGQTLPPFDLQCPVMSLPLLFDTRLETVPARVPYFNIAPDRIARWKDRLGRGQGVNVGLAWLGNPQLATNRIRSISLQTLSALSHIANVAFHSLQITPVTADESSVMQISDYCSHLTDFAETAALIANLDLVITVDTAAAHLAGALGKPTWILLPFAADWRWLMNRQDTPWYPAARLFRQQTPGDWAEVIEQVAEQLKKTI